MCNPLKKRSFLIILLTAFCFRFYYSQASELWFDEILSINLVQGLSSWWSSFLPQSFDNHHVLNSSYLYFYGKTTSLLTAPIEVRSLSVALGVVAVFLVVKLTESKINLIAPTFFALSFPLCIYASEARGYAGLVAFSLSSFYFLQAWESSERRRNLLYFNLSVLLGFLSHFSFSILVLGVLLHSVYQVGTRKYTYQQFFKLNTVPILVSCGVYLIYVQDLNQGSGPLRPHLESLIEAFSMILSGPVLDPGTPLLNLITLGLALLTGVYLIYAINALRIQGIRTWSFYFFTIFIAPIFHLLALEPRIIFPRYILVSIVFAILLIAVKVHEDLQKKSSAKPRAIIILGLFFICSFAQHLRFVRYGRGSFAETLQFVSGQKFCHSQKDQRTKITLAFYQSLDNSVEGAQLSNCESAKFFIGQSSLPYSSPPIEVIENESRFALKKVSPFAGLSGLSWYVYERQYS